MKQLFVTCDPRTIAAQWPAWLLAILIVLPAANATLADEPKPPPAAASPPGSSASLANLIIGIVLENIPHEYEDLKHWGKQTEVFDGLKFSGKPLELKVRAREKKVNHGNWQMYKVTLIDPEHSLHGELTSLERTADGKALVDGFFTARLKVLGRTAHWEYGVQLASFSVEAECSVQLRVQCEVGMTIDPSKIPPDFVLEPKVTKADLDLVKFRVLKLSKLDGPLAREIGRSLRGKIAEKVDDQSPKVAAKLNKSIAKNQDKLRLSASDYLEKQWEQLRKALTPEVSTSDSPMK